MSRRRGLALLLALLLAAAGVAALAEAAEENLLAPEGWTADMWDWAEGVSLLDEVAPVDGSGPVLHIVNFGENDARFVQTAAVEPGTVYLARAQVKASGVAGGEKGANLSIAGTYTYSEAAFDTSGEWVTLELYGITGDDQTILTLMARLGGYSNTATGEAWFRDITLTEAERIPEGVAVQSFAMPVSPKAQKDTSEEPSPEEAAAAALRGRTALLAGAGLITSLAAAALLLYASRHGERLDRRGRHPERLWVLLAAALLARIAAAVLHRGYPTDVNCFLTWSERVFRTGLSGFYSPDYFCDYPPGYMYVLWAVGALRTLLGATGDTPDAWLLMKLPSILADVAACALIWNTAEEKWGGRDALAVTLLYALGPAVLLDSAVWGQADGLLSLLVALTFCFAARERWTGAMLLYAVAVLVKPQALLFAPLGLFALVWSVSQTEEKRRTVAEREAAWGLVGALALFVALAMPFARTQTSEIFPEAPHWLQPLLWIGEKYLGTLGSYSYYTVNACNLWDLLGFNWVPIGPGAARIAGWAAYALAFLFAFWMYARTKNPRRIFLIGACALSCMFCFGLKMHERYLFPALLMLLLAYAEDRDARVSLAAVTLGLAQTLNIGLVLLYDHIIYVPRALAVATDLLALAGCALLVWTCLDLCLREKTMAVTRIYTPSAQRLERQEQQARRAAGSGLFDAPESGIGLSGRERLTIAAVTALYALFTFLNLGSLQAPQTMWTSSAPGETVIFDLGEVRPFQMTYYGGICNTSFTVEYSQDGENWDEPFLAVYNQGEIFRWLWYKPSARNAEGKFYSLGEYGLTEARAVRVTAERAGLVLAEIAFLDADGKPLPVAAVYTRGGTEEAMDPLLLIDEQGTVPAAPSYFNGTYFDEIYHVRTAYEHLHGMHAYEWTHPPLGKLLIASGIALFGMTPFGWRFAGALSGVIMLPLMYLLVRQLTKRRFPAFFAMALLALDCMHFTQSRLGTIDCFAVMFIMCMYLAMFRYAKMNFYHQSLRRTLAPLALSGISFALGCATKWICIYAGAGLAVLFFYTLGRRFAEHRYACAGMRAFTPEEKKIAQRAERTLARNAALTCLWCVLFFVIVPIVVYYFSYYWHLEPDGNFSVKGVWELQKTMFNYHKGLGDDPHFFRSPWYEWPLIIRPMWYYSGYDFVPADMVSSISCMGNPAVWWGGLAALFYVLWRAVRMGRRDRRCAWVLIGFASQFLPWVLVPRSTFIYHYFASVPFIILCAAILIDDIEKRDRRLAVRVGGIWIGAATALCAMFYPIMSGLPFPRRFAKYLRWFHWYNYQ